MWKAVEWICFINITNEILGYVFHWYEYIWSIFGTKCFNDLIFIIAGKICSELTMCIISDRYVSLNTVYIFYVIICFIKETLLRDLCAS